MSADYLSLVMRSMGDYSKALALNQEKIDWDASHDATMSLSVSRFMRGQILKLMGDYNAAIAEFEAARRLSMQLDDLQGIAFADQRICEAHIELGQLTARTARVRERAAQIQHGAVGGFDEGDHGAAGAHRAGNGASRARARHPEQSARSQRRRLAAARRRFHVSVACPNQRGLAQLPRGILLTCRNMSTATRPRTMPSAIGRRTHCAHASKPTARSSAMHRCSASSRFAGAVEPPGAAAALECRGRGGGRVGHRAAHLLPDRQSPLPPAAGAAGEPGLPDRPAEPAAYRGAGRGGAANRERNATAADPRHHRHGSLQGHQ